MTNKNESNVPQISSKSKSNSITILILIGVPLILIIYYLVLSFMHISRENIATNLVPFLEGDDNNLSFSNIPFVLIITGVVFAIYLAKESKSIIQGLLYLVFYILYSLLSANLLVTFFVIKDPMFLIMMPFQMLMLVFYELPIIIVIYIIFYIIVKNIKVNNV